MALVVLSGPAAHAQDAVVVQGPSVETLTAPDSGVLRRSARAADVELLGVFGGLAILALTLTGVLDRRWAVSQRAAQAARRAEAAERPRGATAAARLVRGTALPPAAERRGAPAEPIRR